MKHLFILLAAFLLAVSCEKTEKGANKADGAEKTRNIAVFIPGVRAGSAIYDMLAAGVEKAVSEWPQPVNLSVIEGGYNQAEWEDKVTTLAAASKYDVIISSNPSLPEIVKNVLQKFPAQKFILFDGELKDSPSVYSLRYNQREQAYMAGYIAALVSDELGGASAAGLIAGQEYPAMNERILPAYQEGIKAVNAGLTVDFRVVGNWFDAQKAADLANDMIRGGVKVILTVAGGANDGVLAAAAEAKSPLSSTKTGVKVVWFDTNGYALKEGVVVGSAVLYQDRAAYEKTMLFLKKELPFGTAEIAGVRDGYVDFIEDDAIYQKTVSAGVRQKQAEMINRIRNGELKLE